MLDDQLKISQFLTDAHVEPALRARGITLTTAAATVPGSDTLTGEGPIGSCRHSTTGSCGSTSCTAFDESGGASEGELVCCGTAQTLVRRMCGECTSGCSGSNACGAVGPGGCSVCWGQAATFACATSMCTSTIAGWSSETSTPARAAGSCRTRQAAPRWRWVTRRPGVRYGSSRDGAGRTRTHP